LREGETYGVADARTITEADVVNFAGISSDFHPLHMSTVAAEASDFEGRIAHGNLVFSVAEAMVADMNPEVVLLPRLRHAAVREPGADRETRCLSPARSWRPRSTAMTLAESPTSTRSETKTARQCWRCTHITLVERET